MAGLDYEELHESLMRALVRGMPQSWDYDDAEERIVVEYVREIERRLLAAGGSLERYPEDGDAGLDDDDPCYARVSAALARMSAAIEQLAVVVGKAADA